MSEFQEHGTSSESLEWTYTMTIIIEKRMRIDRNESLYAAYSQHGYVMVGTGIKNICYKMNEPMFEFITS